MSIRTTLNLTFWWFGVLIEGTACTLLNWAAIIYHKVDAHDDEGRIRGMCQYAAKYLEAQERDYQRKYN